MLIAVILSLTASTQHRRKPRLRVLDTMGTIPNLNYNEAASDISNPDRGFYKDVDNLIVPRTFSSLPSKLSVAKFTNMKTEDIWGSGLDVKHSIAHINFGLERFSANAPGSGGTSDLTDGALNYIKAVLANVRAGGSGAIIRFSYDTEGETYGDTGDKGPEPTWRSGTDPAPKDDLYWVARHIAQLTPIFQDYSDVIISLDGGFIGPWGEMHTTKMAVNKTNVIRVMNMLLTAIPEHRTFSIRYPSQWLMWYNNAFNKNVALSKLQTINLDDPTLDPTKVKAAKRIGMFNDGYLADQTDFGSFWDPFTDADIERRNGIAWIAKQSTTTFYGGEYSFEYEDEPCPEHGWDIFEGECNCPPTDFVNNYNRIEFLAWEAFHTHTSHLNIGWNPKLIEYLAETPYRVATLTNSFNLGATGGKNKIAYRDPLYYNNGTPKKALEYVRDRLGYRLVLKSASATTTTTQTGSITFNGTIQNTGFGNIVNKKDVYVVLKNKATNAVYIKLTDIDARNWLSAGSSIAPTSSPLQFTVSLSGMKNFNDVTFTAMTKYSIAPTVTVPIGEYSIYLKICDPLESTKNKRHIRFANIQNSGMTIFDETLGGNLIGETEVTN